MSTTMVLGLARTTFWINSSCPPGSLMSFPIRPFGVVTAMMVQAADINDHIG